MFQWPGAGIGAAPAPDAPNTAPATLGAKDDSVEVPETGPEKVARKP